ncbi:MAG: TonB-dependent receptor [Acidobacteria bacterium]|nr:TonB-dependent receptor [Acidobacteriota bacterium]
MRIHTFARPRIGQVRLFAVAFFSISTAFAQLSSVSGTVKDPSGAGVAGAVVAITTEGNNKKSVLADASGVYGFTGVAPGVLTLEVSAPGFRAYSKPITITAAPYSLDVVLSIANDATTVAVDARLDPYNVVPSAPTQSLFGFDQNLEDIPRSISVADSETMLRYGVKTVNDIVAVSTGSFTGSYFGIAGSVFLRGDIGDNFFRGFRRVENRGNFQTPVAATDHIEVVKGPPSPIYGGGRVGGFLNFIPKSTRSESAKWLEKATGKVTLTYGSYDEKRAGGEVGLPFKLGTHRAGVYSFFEAEDAHSFYKGVANRYKLGQISFDLELSPKLRLVYGFQGFHNEGTQNIGWNRVTQELVDKQMYLSGTPLVNLSRNGYDIRNGDIAPGTLTSFAFQQNMSGPFFSNPGVASLYALDPATVKLVKLPLDRIMIDAGDFSRATTATGYFDINYDVNSNVHIVNQTFMDWMNHQKFSSYGFGAGYRPWTVENKTTAKFEYRPRKWLTTRSIGGFSYRKVTVSAGEERNDFQVVDRRDLSIGATANDRFAGPYNSGSKISYQYFQTGNYGDAGLFWLTDATFFDKLGVTAGVRFDRYSPDFTGRNFGEPNTRAKAAQNATTYNASVSYHLPFRLTPYFTAASSRFLDLGQGNEIAYNQVQDGTFVQSSNLYEGGVKTSYGQKLFASASIFRQKRASYNKQTLAADYYRTTGAEFEARSYLFRRLSLSGALTWQNPEQLNVPFLLGIPPNLLGIDPAKAYAGRFIGVASIFGLKAPLPVGGQPHVVFSPFGTVNVTKNVGFTLGTSWVSPVKTGYISNVKLPSYALARGSVFYVRGKHQFNVAVNNMFDKVYFQSQFLFWDVFIKPGALRTASLTYTLTF